MRNNERLQTSNEEAGGSQGAGEVASNGLAKRITPQEAAGVSKPYEGNNHCHHRGQRTASIVPGVGSSTEEEQNVLIFIEGTTEPKARGPFGDIQPA